MSFCFRITDTWESASRGIYHVIGILERGTILPNVEAVVDGPIPKTLFINSVAIINYRGPKPHPDQYTLSVKKPAFDLATIKGCMLRGDSAESG